MIKKSSLSIKDNRNKLNQFLRDIDSKYEKVTVGIHSKEGMIKTEDGESTVLGYAIINEFGLHGIPSRPFIRQSFNKNLAELEKKGTELFQLVIKRALTMKQALGNWGSILQGMIIREINEGNNFTPNTEFTKARKPKGLHPLQGETGALVRSIKTQIKKE